MTEFNPNSFDLNNTIISQADNRVSTRTGEETVILDLASGQYHGLDEVGTTIWDLIQSPITYEALINRLTHQYEISRADCARDTKAFFKKLAKEGLITINRI